MAFKQMVTAKTATGDTVKTLIDTVTVPAGCTKLVAVASNVYGSGALTTAEAGTGYLELESDDISIVPAQFLLDTVSMLTGGAIGFTPKQWPCDILVSAANRIKVYVTMDMAQTGALTARACLTFA